jgi:chromosome partitioning protein
MSQTIAVLSQKGGTGKTTAVRTLADVLRRRGISTLAVDLDPQGNLSDYFGMPVHEPTIAEVLSGRARIIEAIGEDLVTANLTLAEVELLLAGQIGRELRLRRALAEVGDHYEVILIDCPPSLGLLTVNALVASDWALISAAPQYFSLQGIQQAMEVVELARDTLNPELSVLGLLLNRANMHTRHSRAALAQVRERYGTMVFDTVVRTSIAYAETAQWSRSILDHRPDLGRDYLVFASELLGRVPSIGCAHEPPLELVYEHPSVDAYGDLGYRDQRLPASRPQLPSESARELHLPSATRASASISTDRSSVSSASSLSSSPRSSSRTKVRAPADLGTDTIAASGSPQAHF